MGKAIIQYQADDGSIFSTSEACLTHEEACRKIHAIMEPMGLPNNSSAGWVQHDPATVRRCYQELLKYAKPMLKSWPEITKLIDEGNFTPIQPMGIVGRIFSEMGGPINGAWFRFCCTDDLGREHNQPYYAINGPDRSHVCICLSDRMARDLQ